MEPHPFYEVPGLESYLSLSGSHVQTMPGLSPPQSVAAVEQHRKEEKRAYAEYEDFLAYQHHVKQLAKMMMGTEDGPVPETQLPLPLQESMRLTRNSAPPGSTSMSYPLFVDRSVVSAPTDPGPSLAQKEAAALAQDWRRTDVTNEIVSTTARMLQLRVQTDALSRAGHHTVSATVQTESMPEDLDVLVRRRMLKAKEAKKRRLPKPPVYDSDAEHLEQLLANGPSHILIEKYRIPLTVADLRTVMGTSWLNDEVINFYTQMCQERNNRIWTEFDGTPSSMPPQTDREPRCHFNNTFFFTKLVNDGVYNYKAVRRWTKRAKVDIFAKDCVLIPIHMGLHWAFAVINFSKHRFEFINSLGTSGAGCLAYLRRYVQDESLDKKQMPFDLSGWTEEVPTDNPQQTNCHDCGVFMLMGMACVSRNLRLSSNISQDEMEYFRKRIALDMLAAGERMPD